jgi:LacI family gluconate utilization system Gnt-I transcriptional repressor
MNSGKGHSKRDGRSSGRVTLDDVAAAAGVSRITVSRALRGERQVAPELVERALAAANRLGYVPDPAARALASSKSSHVAILIPLLSNQLFVELLEGVQRTLLPAGYQTLMGVTHYDANEEEQLLKGHLLHRPAGLLVTGNERPESTRRLIAQSGVPCVHLMETLAEDGAYSVGFSQRDAARAITQHLIDGGRRRIAFAAAQLDPRTLQRAEGYRACLQQAGLYDPTLEWLNPAPSSMKVGATMFEQIASMRPRVDAIFFCNDDLAHGGLLTALRLGLKVPKQIAVAGFNDLPGSAEFVPSLTTIKTPRWEIGARAAQMLLQLMRGEPVAERSLDLGFELVVRQSTASA